METNYFTNYYFTLGVTIQPQITEVLLVEWLLTLSKELSEYFMKTLLKVGATAKCNESAVVPQQSWRKSGPI